MVTFVTLFLSLVTGAHPVTVAVGDPVVAVELRLDGKTLGTLRGEPYSLVCDFGPDLSPHELLAIGYDRDGSEVTRQQQWVNLPTARTSLDILLEDAPEGLPRTAKVVWQTIEGHHPTALRVTFDGEPIPLTDPRSIPLPAYDPSEIHVLAAELVFPDLTHRAAITLGGTYSESVETELTAIPVISLGRKRIDREQIASWFLRGGEALTVAGLEHRPAEVIMIQDPSLRTQKKLRWLGQGLAQIRLTKGIGNVPAGIRQGDWFRFMMPTAESSAETAVPVELFPLGPNLGHLERGLMETILYRYIPGDPGIWDRAIANPRLADAVAIAGLAASRAGRPRAVVLLADAESPDSSRFEASQVREYLQKLRVPLQVWSPFRVKKSTPHPWGPSVVEASSPYRMFLAMGKLREMLDHQTVVWLEGLHLPHQVRLAPEALEHLRLAGASPEGALDLDVPTNLEPELAELEKASEDTGEGTASTVTATAELDSPGVEEAILDPEVELASFEDSLEVEVVNVDVVVTDRKGRAVTDLTREDFTIYEDGEPVEITHFVPPPPRPEEEPPAPAPQSSAPSEESSPRAEASAQPPLHVVLFVDNTRMLTFHRKKMTRSLQAFLGEDLPPETELMLATYNRSLYIDHMFTSDTGQIVDRLEGTLRGRGPSSSDRQNRRDSVAAINDVSESFTGAARSGLEEDLLSAESRQDSVLAELEAQNLEQRQLTRNVLAAMQRLVESLGGVEGRKVMIYVGDGLSLDPTANARVAAEVGLQLSGTDLASFNHRQYDTALYYDFKELIDHANANRVTFYTLTPPLRDEVADVEVGSAGPVNLRQSLQSHRIARTKEAVCLMSGSTGGRCQSGGSDPSLLLDATRADFGAVYSMAFSPRPDRKRGTHKIEVEVDRPKLKVRYREGYVDRAPEERLRDRLNATLLFGEDQNPLAMEIDLEKDEPLGDDRHLLHLRLRVPVHNLALLPTTDPAIRQTRMKLLITTMDHRGDTTGVQEIPISFQVTADRLQGPTRLEYAHKVHLTLTSGPQRIALGLWDELGRSGSFLSQEVEVGTDTPHTPAL